ncbi:hypothetical protein HN803_00170 [candidate division WWE3 bacterium]|jgi:hypothetical protein|nr:hypothetical protein [candidate division WWE3 bacterium]MBT7349200.1 hypothetical protein [candidate division WWE3 bacterium]
MDQTQDNSIKEKKNKIPLLILFVLFVILSPFGAFLLFERYLEKTIYEDRKLILQYEAEEVLETLPLSSVTKGFLGLISYVHEEYLNEYYLLPNDTLLDLLTDYDHTQKNAVFEVIGAGATASSLELRFVFPSSLENFELQSNIECTVSSTVAGEVTTSSTEDLGESEVGTFLGYDKELEVKGRIPEFILSLLDRSDVENGQSRLYLKGLCSDYECTAVLDNCLIEVVSQ